MYRVRLLAYESGMMERYVLFGMQRIRVDGREKEAAPTGLEVGFVDR